MPDIFISYSSADKQWVKKLVKVLGKFDLDIWWDPEIKPGQIYRKIIQNALDNSNCVIVVWSKESVKSKWVQAEANQAVQRDILIPISYGNVRIPVPFNAFQTVNMTQWNGDIPDKKLMKLILEIGLHCNNLVPYKELQKNETQVAHKKQRKIENSKSKKNIYRKLLLYGYIFLSLSIIMLIFGGVSLSFSDPTASDFLDFSLSDEYSLEARRKEKLRKINIENYNENIDLWVMCQVPIDHKHSF